MKKIIIAAALTAVMAGCDAPEDSWGVEKVVLTKQSLIHTISSSYFTAAPDSSEPVDETIMTANVYHTGVPSENHPVKVTFKADRAYTQQLIDGTIEEPSEAQSLEMEALAGCDLLPEDCYTIPSLEITIPGNGYVGSLPVILHKDKIAALDPFADWVLPAFSIAGADLPVGGSFENFLAVVKTVREIHYEPLPDDLSTGWMNVLRPTDMDGLKNGALPDNNFTAIKVWSDVNAHKVQWIADGDKNTAAASNRWVPYTQSGATEAPWIEIDLGKTRTIDGIKFYYCEEANAVRDRCYVWVKNGAADRWRKAGELRNESLENIVSYTLFGNTATHIRLTWDLIKQPSATYFLKLKELEVYTKTN